MAGMAAGRQTLEKMTWVIRLALVIALYFGLTPPLYAEQYLVSLHKAIKCHQSDVNGDGIADQVDCGRGNENYVPCPDHIWWILNSQVVVARNDPALNPEATFVCVR